MDRRKSLPLGYDDFRKVMENNGYYVDKTLLIKKLLQTKSEVTLFTRPRRFGKTLNMSMLQNFFENTEETEELFHGLRIEKEEEVCRKYRGQYSVITLSLKSAKQSSFQNAFEMIKQTISQEFRRHIDAVASYEYEQDRIERILNAQGEEKDYLTSLQFLSQILYHVYGRKVIVLLDEYDVPLENAHFRGFYEEMVTFIRSLFESVLKGNPCLEFAVVTGCLRISKESIFTGLNNLHSISILNEGYAEYFGFTEEEVEEILSYYGLNERMEDMKSWYDGYLFGNVEIYNPWSVMSFVSDLLENEGASMRPYWSNTSSNSIIKTLVETEDLQVRNKIEALISGEMIESVIHEDITYADVEHSEENLWNFLYFTGYLKKVSEHMENGQIYMGLRIPNEEIRYIYRNKIMEWTKEKIEHSDLSTFYEAMLNGNVEVFQEELEGQLQDSISYFDAKEAFYHGFLLGLLKPIKNYLVESNREAGDGRFDLLVRSPDVKKSVVVLELKRAESYKEMEKCANAAIEQIDRMHYMRELERDGYEHIIRYGIGFYKKNCKVALEKKN
ncbi:AAA family ATPase [Roseburia hominis]